MRTALSRLLAVAAIAAVVFGGNLLAQSGPPPSTDPNDQPASSEGPDAVSTYNGQLSLTVPIGPVFTVGPGLSFQAKLHYSSRVWAPGDWVVNPGPNPEPFILLQGDPAMGLGWRFSLGQIVESSAGTPSAFIAPDGSAHQLYVGRKYGDGNDGYFYSRDGSYIRVKYLGSISAGYEVWTPDGNVLTLAHNVTGYDEVGQYRTDVSATAGTGRGRNGFFTTAIANPYGDSISVTYQSTKPWVPYQITIPSIGGSSSRTITIGLNGSGLVSTFTLPTLNSSTGATYTLSYSSHGQLSRPGSPPHPNANTAALQYLDRIDLPNVGYASSYTFSYYDSVANPQPPTAYARGALKSQKIPTGATITYEYGTWAFYHANPQNRMPPPYCSYPPGSFPSGLQVYRTGPGIEPSLPSVQDCNSPDRVAGIVRRTIDVGNSATSYYVYAFPYGEQGSDTASQSETLVVSPADAAGNHHSTTYLFAASTPSAISGPLVGALLRTAVFNGDATGGSFGYGNSGFPGPVCSNALFCQSNSSVRRIVEFSYETDAYNPSPTAFVEANRRVIQKTTVYNTLPVGQTTSGKYHQVAYVYDANAGQYSKETHSGNLGSDARESQTTWSPLISSSSWKLDRLQKVELRATANGTDFSTFTNDSFDAAGNPTHSTTLDGSTANAGSLVHAFPRDSHGNPSSETFTLGSASYTKTVTYASGTLKTSSWGSLGWKTVDNDIDTYTGLVTTSYDSNRSISSSLKTVLDYDLFGRLKETTPANLEAHTKTSYDSTTQSTTTRQPQGTGQEVVWSRTILDGIGRVVKQQRKIPGSSLGNGQTVKKIVRFDAQGNKSFESEWVDDAVNDGSLSTGTSWTGFDEFGRPTTITKTDGKTTNIDYSDTNSPASVWKKKVTINDVGGVAATTTYNYDAFGNLSQVTESVNSDVTTYAYNPQDKLIGVTQGQQTRTYTYDAFGFLRTMSTPETNPYSDVFTYDPLGNVLTESHPDSISLTRTYDAAARLRTIALQPGSIYAENCYDGNGSCTSNTNFSGGTYPLGKLTRRIGKNYDASSNVTSVVTEDFTYSEATGRLSQKATTVSGLTGAIPAVTERWYYDQFGQPVDYYHPRTSGTFMEARTFDYGLPVAISANGIPVVVQATYRPSGALATYVTGTNTGHNVTTTIAEDTTGYPRPGRISTTGASSNFDTGLYAYDGAGNIKTIGADTFTYDKESRLLNAAYSGLGSQAFDYDRYGNLKYKGTTASPFTVDLASNRITSYTANSQAGSLTYNNRGEVLTNLLGTTTETYTWDALDRNTRYQVTGGIDWKYTYDASGERVVKVPAAGTDYFYTFRDAAKRIATEYQGPALSRDNAYLGNLLVATYASCPVNGTPGWQFLSSDHLGSPRLATDANGTTLDARKYWPFGDLAAGGASAERVQFVGMERDSEGNRYYDHARSEDFNLSRFLTPDMFPGEPNRPQSWNRYAYAADNPARVVDPDGRDGVDVADAADARIIKAVDTADVVLTGDLRTAVQVTGFVAMSYTSLLRVGSSVGEAIGSGQGLVGAVVTDALRAAGIASLVYPILSSAVRTSSVTEQLVTRASEIHDVLDPIAQTHRTTAALETDGPRIIAGGGRDLTPAQRAMVGTGEVAARMPGADAEVTALAHAEAAGLSPRAIGVTRDICPSCALVIQKSGGTLTSPTTAVWP
jgi:RHS repeat-associated protein